MDKVGSSWLQRTPPGDQTFGRSKAGSEWMPQIHAAAELGYSHLQACGHHVVAQT